LGKTEPKFKKPTESVVLLFLNIIFILIFIDFSLKEKNPSSILKFPKYIVFVFIPNEK
jgi:hypothetical protein